MQYKHGSWVNSNYTKVEKHYNRMFEKGFTTRECRRYWERKYK